MVLPESANLDDIVDAHLVAITEAISKVAPDKVSAGLLGGEFGYGAGFENEVFMMHPYCWCEQDDCRWCQGCACPETAFHYFVDGVEVDYNEWIAFYEREVGNDVDVAIRAGDYQHPHLNERQAATDKRRTQRHDPVCDYCTKHGGEPAPNFRHKASGFEARWYKWIGRDMEIKAPDGVDVRAVLGESLASVRA